MTHDDLKSWPFVEARKVAEHTKDKEFATFATGYGPSGLPHIGTFGEVIRTTMVVNAYRKLTGKPARLIVFSDDMDALRKVPDNVPNRDMLEKYLNHSLSSVPNPFDTKEDSFSAHNNAQLRAFLDSRGFSYEFISSTECYKSGMFNDVLKVIADNALGIKEIVTKDYGIQGGNRKDTYCPFIPVGEGGKQFFELTNWSIDSDYNIVCDEFTLPIYDGNVKCQWKVDWPMRWIKFGVDYEMHGKDLIGSAQVGQRICKALGHRAPINYMYELFLDENGEKISKSKGNGLDFNDWVLYSSPATIAYYMFQNPRKARKLHFGVIPQMTDDYLKWLDTYNDSPSMDNPVWHVHGDNVPEEGSPVSFSMLLNLISITNTSDPVLAWDFVRNYAPNATPERYPMLDILIHRAINYYENKVLPFKNYRSPDENEKNTLISLHASLRLFQKEHEAFVEFIQDDCDETEIEPGLTSVIYEVGKHHYGEKGLRDFFQMIYEVIMGQSSGPRLPVFVMLLGIDEFLAILKEKIK